MRRKWRHQTCFGRLPNTGIIQGMTRTVAAKSKEMDFVDSLNISVQTGVREK